MVDDLRNQSLICTYAYHQIENFGMHLSVDGSIVYGIIVEAILGTASAAIKWRCISATTLTTFFAHDPSADRKAEHISLDHLSRLLVDVHQDSTKIMDDLLSQYQRR